MRFDSIDLVEKERLKLEEKKKGIVTNILVCAGTGCVAGGSLQVYQEFFFAALWPFYTL